MKLIGLKELEDFKDNSIITIGFFDGVHLGHQKIINKMKEYPQYKSVVITFEDDVLKMFKISDCIYDLSKKLSCFEMMGIDYVLLLRLSDNFQSMDARSFMVNVLDKLNTKVVVAGSDFSFAKNRQGNADYIKNNSDYKLIMVDDVYVDNIKVSSTLIRSLLNDGNIPFANRLLFSKLSLSSKVIEGKRIGRTINFPTINLVADSMIIMLRKGVYFGRTLVDNKSYYSIINVGFNPTIDDTNELSIEAHLIGFDANIYGKDVTVEFDYFSRDEKRFDNIESLKKMISQDLLNCKGYYGI